MATKDKTFVAQGVTKKSTYSRTEKDITRLEKLIHSFLCIPHYLNRSMWLYMHTYEAVKIAVCVYTIAALM